MVCNRKARVLAVGTKCESGETPYSPDPVPYNPVFCAILPIVNMFASAVTYVVTDDDVYVESTGAAGFSAQFQQQGDLDIGGKKVWAEVTVLDVDPRGPFIAAGLAFGDLVPGAPGLGDGVFIAVGTGAADAAIYQYSDVVTPIVTGITIPAFPYTIQLRADGTTGEITYVDTLGNSGTVATDINITTTPVKYISFAGGNPSAIGDYVNYKYNSGTSQPVINVPPGYLSYCEALIPDPGPCEDILPTLDILTGDVDVVEDGYGGYYIENTDASGGGISKISEDPRDFNGLKVWAEITFKDINPTGANARASLGIGAALMSVGDGIDVYPGTGAADGEIRRISDSAVLQGGLSITFPYTVQLQLDGTTDNMYWEDSLGNSGLVINNPDLTATPLWYLFIAEPDFPGLGNYIDLIFNFGRQAPVVAPPVDYVGWCGVPEGDMPYRWYTLFNQGEGDIDPADERKIICRNDAITAAQYTGTMGNFPFTPGQVLQGNTYEVVIEKLEPGTLDDLVRTGVDGFLVTQVTFDFDDSDRLEVFTQATGLDYDQQTVIANNIQIERGDVMAVSVFDVGEASPDYRQTIQHGGYTIFYDPIRLPPPSSLVEFTSFGQFWTTSLVPDNNEAVVRFNGVDEDMVIDNYPNSFRDFRGDPMPTKVVPEDRQSLIVPWTRYDQPGATITIDAARKVLTFENDGVGVSEILAHFSTFMYIDSGIRVVEIELTEINASGDEQYILELRALNRRNSYMAVKYVGSDLVLEVQILNGPINTEVIKANYVPFDGDVLAIAADTDNGVATAVGYLYQGLVYESDPLAFDAGFLGAAYMPMIGHEAIPVSEETTITSQLKAADMDSALKNAYPTGAKDLEGSTI